MNSIIEMITQQLSGGGVQQMSQQIGADTDKAGQAVSAAVPLLISALARNASNREGATALHQALDRDHDGSILDDVTEFLGDPSTGDGSGILRHVLGDRRGAVESGLAQASGLNSNQFGQVLEMLAPVVMGALGRAQRQQNLDADGLAALLGGEQQAVRAAAPGVMGMLSQFLDADKDGSVMDDLAGLAGKFFSGR